ncbi:MAG: ricin-type beta-trefoil lectin domain protein, partial [Streptosporangiaceae bacterium]
SNGQPGLCDATARFNVSSSGADVTPAWVNYAGGDSFRSVVVAGSVVYVGGHNRWLNNECGNNNVCGYNPVLVGGIGAIDANTGYTLPWWHPMTGRGRGVQSLTIYPAGTFPGSDGGLLLGTDVDSIGGAVHHELAMFPLTSTASHRPGGPILNGMFSQGFLNGLDETSDGTPPMCVDDQSDGASPGSVVDLATCDNSSEQNWAIESGGTIQVNGLCLDAQGGATAPGTPLVLNTCGKAASQVWTQSAGDTVINEASGLCLDDPGSSTTSGTQLDISTCNGETEQTWPLPAAQAAPTTPPVGPVYDAEVQSDDGVPCMADYENSVAQGTKVVISTCKGFPVQNWTLEPDGTIQHKGKCLDTAGGGFNSGIVLDMCTGASSQVWQVGSNYELANQASRMCLTDPSLTTGTQLDVQSCDGGSSQQWRLPSN